MNLARSLRWCASIAVLPLLAGLPLAASAQRVTVPLGLVAGMTRQGPADRNALLRIDVELEPKQTGLEAAAAAIADPASPAHRMVLTRDQFEAHYSRPGADITALRSVFSASGGSDIYTAHNGLLVGALLSVAQAERAFHVPFVKYVLGTRTAVAPSGPLDIPAERVRAVRGVVAVTTPRLADVTPTFTYFRGDWYSPDRFREAYDAIPDGGRGQHVTLIEDASDRADLKDIRLFTESAGAPAGASDEDVNEHQTAFKSPAQTCGRDDRGQEPTLDIDAVLTLAPRAVVDVDYDDVCSFGNQGTVALQRALDAAEMPTVIVFPFTVGTVTQPVETQYGPPPIPLLEAAMLGIPVVAAAGDDGAYGMRLPEQTTAAVTYPCVLPLVMCAGGTQLGDRDTKIDEAVWNDRKNAGGGGVSQDPRPSWQDAPGGFEFSKTFRPADHRLVPDISADASGHLRVFWHGYGEGGIGGTSESSALIGAQLAAINAAVPAAKRLTSPGDLYALARSAPSAFRDVTRENDRGFSTNTLRVAPKPLPLGYRGIVPSPSPLANGCVGMQQNGCQVRPGYDAVTGIGSLKERAAAAALQ